jgi:nucleoside-diphosphate-sugar epimerase
MSTYLVTGGAGFIGSNIVTELVKRGQTVRVLDNLSTGKKENLADVWGAVTFIEADICSMPAAKKACDGADYVIHLAAIPSVPRSVKDPLSSNHANVTGTLTLLQAAKEAQVKRLVYAGSSSAYGDQDATVKTEDLKPRPMSPYAVSKLAAENYCKVYNDLFSLSTVVLRYFNVFGPRQDPQSPYSAVIPLFIKALLAGKSPTIYGDGKQSRDFTYVQNNVEGTILACTAPKAAGEVINIACGESITLNGLMKEINDALGTKIDPLYASPRAGDVQHSKAGIDKAKELLGYAPVVGLKEGIKMTVEWMRRQ